MTSESLWNYYRHEIDNIGDDASSSKSLKNKKKLQLAQPPVPQQEDINQQGTQYRF